MNRDDLKAKGWTEAPDGSWSKRSNLGQVVSAKREPDPVQTLDSRHAPCQSRKASLDLCIEIVAFRRRLLDDDNNTAGNKPLRDAIAKSLGVDDGDPRLKWTCRQCLTDGETGTLVKITVL